MSSVSVCHALVFAGFSGRGNSIQNIIPLLKKENALLAHPISLLSKMKSLNTTCGLSCTIWLDLVWFDLLVYQSLLFIQCQILRGCPRDVMVKAMDCRIVVSGFLFRSLSGKYHWERYEPPYPPSYGLNSTTIVLLGEWLWH